MRKLLFQMMVSADGFMEGPNGELGWHVVDADFTAYVDRMLRSIDAILLGRATYEALAGYWPTAKEPEAHLMNALPKYVFSSTLPKADWSNTQIVRRPVEQEIVRLMQEPGRDLALFGSSRLASSLVSSGLIDEYRLLVCPIFLGSGRPLFAGVNHGLPLHLTKSETFQSGVVCLYYRSASERDPRLPREPSRRHAPRP